MKYNDPTNRAIIGGVRYCGKTTELIKEAARFRCLIVCASRARADFVDNQARDMGLFIEHPQDILTLLAKPETLRARHMTILIDDVADVLETVLGQRVAIMSTSANLEPLNCLAKEDENDAT